jgi:UDP-N-acetylmuramoylalanine--D-glutamate ligase
MACDEVPLKGRHNIENVAAAITACPSGRRSVGLHCRECSELQGVEHRLEPSPKSRSAILQRLEGDERRCHNQGAGSLESGVILILGGRDKGGDFKMLSDLLRNEASVILLRGQ